MNSSTYVVGGWVKIFLFPLLPLLARMWLSLGKPPLCLLDVPLVLADPSGTF
jgi:hypothetical protein